MNYTKRIDGDYTISMINDTDVFTISSNTVDIQGNLQVAGNLVYVETDTLQITDPFIYTNISNSGVYASNAGIITQKSASGYAAIRFNATEDKWEFTSSTNQAGTSGTYSDMAAQGTTGAQGAQGIQGTQGVVGSQGVQGVQGTQGIQGVQGTQGVQGVQGTQGIQGLQGIQGVQGTQGIQGITGTQGVTGAQGTQGIQGTDGTAVAQGAQGAQGTQGIQGVQGVQGTQGVQGVQGTQGVQGVQGTTGTQGIQGITGPSTTIDAVDTNTNLDYELVFVSALGSPQTANGSTSLYYNPSTDTLTAPNTSTLASSAKYADLAERFSVDQTIDPATVVVFGGNAEITQSTRYADPFTAGVVSTDPAYLMNSMLDESAPLVLAGRAPCKVIGPITKGDILTTSDTPGHATKLDNKDWQPGVTVGRALESCGDGEHIIEIVVGCW